MTDRKADTRDKIILFLWSLIGVGVTATTVMVSMMFSSFVSYRNDFRDNDKLVNSIYIDYRYMRASDSLNKKKILSYDTILQKQTEKYNELCSKIDMINSKIIAFERSQAILPRQIKIEKQ